jgi:hypothetical protein
MHAQHATQEEHAALAYAAAGFLACLAQQPTWGAELTATAAATKRVSALGCGAQSPVHAISTDPHRACCFNCHALQLVAVCVDLLTGPHDRSRLPAVQLLLVLSRQPLQVPRLAPALPALLSLLADAGGPRWAGGKVLARGCCGVLAALLAPSECEAAELQQVRQACCC